MVMPDCWRDYFLFSCTFPTLYLVELTILSNKMEENGFLTKQSINDCILRSAWSEYPLPPLHRACRDGDILSLTYLTVQGDRQEVYRSINQEDRCLAWTPAHWAAYFGKLECLQHLAAHGLSTDVLDGRFKQSLAHLAAVADQPRVLLWLIQNGVSVEKQDSLGETPVHKAVRSGSMECLDLLKSYGAPLSIQNNNQQTPYDVAVSLELQQCAYYLKNHGCPSGSTSRTCKRSLDDDCYVEGTKRARNGVVQYSGYVEVFGSSLNEGSPVVTNGIHMHLASEHQVNKDEEMNIEVELNTSFVEHPSDHQPCNGYSNIMQTNVLQANHRKSFSTPPQRCRMLCSHLQ